MLRGGYLDNLIFGEYESLVNHLVSMLEELSEIISLEKVDKLIFHCKSIHQLEQMYLYYKENS